MIEKYKIYIKIVAALAVSLLFIGNASALAYVGTTDSVNCGGPYSMVMGREVLLTPTVTITDIPEQWMDTINNPESEVWATVYFGWDFDGDMVYEDFLVVPASQRIGSSTTTMTFTGYGDCDYFVDELPGVYDAELQAYISITGEDISFGDNIYCSTTVEVRNPIVADAGKYYSGIEDTPVNFDGTGSYDIREFRATAAVQPMMVAAPDMGIKDYEWDFDGDGEYDDGTGSTPEYIFTEPGTYTVGLKVTSWDGINDTDTASVNIASTSNNQIPEFPTIALPVAAIIGLAFVMQRRKD